MTRDRREIREKTRAVLLAAIMIVSVFGGTMAFAGTAAAGTNSIDLSDNLVQGGETIEVNGTVDSNGTVYAFIDEDGDGEFNSSEGDSISDRQFIGDFEQDNEFSISLNAPSESGAYDVYVTQIEGDSSEGSISNGVEGDQSAELQVDADAPVFGNETPEDDTTVTDEQDIVVPITDDEEGVDTGVASVRATVTSGNEEITFEIDPDTAEADGVSFSNNNLTISPGTGSVPSISDGDYTVDLTATDEAGNSNTTEPPIMFSIDGDDPTVDFVTPDEDDFEPFITSDANQSIKVDLASGRTLNDSTAELIIDGEGEYEETLNNSFGGYSDGTFNIDEDGDIPPLPDGDVTLTASVDDEIGNSVTESLTFEVDTDSPNVTNVELTDDAINISDRDDDGEAAIITFDEPVEASSVTIDVNVDGGPTTINTGQEYEENENFEDNESEVIVPLDQSGALDGEIENDSAVVNVTDADDLADARGSTEPNSLGNANVDVSNTTFSIDTDGPSVGTDGLPAESTLSGYANVTAFIDSQATSDVDETTVAIEVGGQDGAVQDADELPGAIDQNALIDITGTAENLTTQADTYPDGTHVLVVAVQDDAGNPAFATTPFTLDNGEGATINQTDTNYLPGVVTPVDVGTSDVDVSEVFNEEESELEYEVNGNEFPDDSVIEAEDNRGQTVNVSAETEDGSDSTLPVQIQFAPLIGAESVSGDEISIGVETDAESLEELNVTVEDTDGHFAQTERQLTRDDFTEYGDDSGIYTADPEGFDDGVYEVTVTDAVENGDDVLGQTGLDENTEAIVDAEDPSAETAYVTGSDGQATFVRVEFNEVVDDVAAEDVSFDGSGDAVVNVDNGADDGILNVTLDGEVQTADAPLLNVSGVTETNGDGTTLEDDASTEVATASFDLSSDQLNVISIPAESGRVDISETAFNSDAINTVSAYDADTGEFEQFSPGAEDNDLTNLEGGVGYVVNVEEDTTVEINAENAPAANDRTQQSVEAGWNLVGHYQEGQQQVGQALTPLGDQVYQIEEGYTGSQLTNDAALNPEQGYWLFTNDGGLHVPVNYGGPTSEKPDVFVPSGESFVDTTEPTNTGKVTITVAVDTDAAVQTVRADAPDLGIEDAELSSAGGPSVQGATSYTGTFDVNYQAGYDGAERSITVSAITTDGNVGSNSVDVDPVDRSGSVSITDADFSDLTEGDTANVTVETSYNAGGFENAELSIKNSSGVEIGSEAAPDDSGSSYDVEVELSSLDDGENITAELIDAGEASDYVVADDTTSVSGLQDLAYTENSPSTIVGTGADAVQSAENTVADASGVTVYVESGTYNAVEVDKSGVTLTAAPGVSRDEVTISDVRILSASASSDPANDVTISGFTVQAEGNDALSVETGGPAQTGLTVADNTLVAPEGGFAVFAADLSDSTFDGNTFTVADGAAAQELVYIGGEATYGSDRATTGVNITDNVFEGDVDRDQQAARAGGNAIEFEATGDSEITGNNFTDVSTDEGVKVVYSSQDVTIAETDNEGLSTNEIHLIAGTVTFEDANLTNNDLVNVTANVEYDSTATVTITNSSDTQIGSAEITADGSMQSITVDNTASDVSDGDILEATLTVPNNFELDTDTTTANKTAPA